MLEPLRIKSMTSDISKHMRKYHAKINKSDSDSYTEKIKCLKGVKLVVHHHSGNHSQCCIEDCLYLQIEKEENDLNSPRINQTFTKDDILELIMKRYCEISRFKGKHMDLSIAGQYLLAKIITSRLNEINLEKVGEILSSNCCENYFSVLTKYSHGKRINGDYTDTWRVQCAVVCGLISNPKFVLEIMEKLGVSPNEIRTESVAKLNTRKVYQKNTMLIKNNKTGAVYLSKFANTQLVRSNQASIGIKQIR